MSDRVRSDRRGEARLSIAEKAALPGATVDPAAVQEISDWLVARGLDSSPVETAVGDICERLRAAGVPIARVHVTMRTLHPSVDAISVVWRHGHGVEHDEFSVGTSATRGWQESPFRTMLETQTSSLRRRLTGPGAELDYPVLEEFAAEGMTDYLVRMVGFSFIGSGPMEHGLISSWATDAPEGFSEGDVAAIERLLPRLALVVLAKLSQDIAVNLVDTYLGREAGRRVLHGQIRKGSMGTIHAVILLCDLRGFTAASDRLSRAKLAKLLDDYFEAIVPAVRAKGGEVLKYLGDGLLATFNLEGRSEDAICREALEAAFGVLSAVNDLNERRRAAGEAVLDLDIALHLGDVMFGNIGAADRLDFTVVGPTVNEAARIEALCQGLGRHLLISEAFARAATDCAEHLVSVGRYALRGVRGAQELYTLDRLLE